METRKPIVSGGLADIAKRVIAQRELTGENPVFDAWQAATEAKKLAKQRRLRQQNEEVILTVGTHEDCGGEIEYVSKFHAVGVVRLGGQNEMKEAASCHCKQCGVMFNPFFAKYRDQVVAHRNRTTE